ncbi:MAG: carboxymuconolactone decarboxylase family protein [Trebonia sp.]
MRLPALTELTSRQQEVSDAIAAKRGATRGPFLIWLRSPELAEKVDALGAYCRFESHINERLRELSLLITARHFDAQYSWNAHHKKAIEAGVTPESIKELANNEAPHFAHADEQLLYGLATQILRDHFVDTGTFGAALAEWGEAGLVDVIGCLGNFSMLAMLLNTFQVDLKPGDPAPFPNVRGFAKAPRR